MCWESDGPRLPPIIIVIVNHYYHYYHYYHYCLLSPLLLFDYYQCVIVRYVVGGPVVGFRPFFQYLEITTSP